MKYGKWELGQIEALLNIIGEDNAKKILARTVEVIIKAVSYITATYKVVMDYNRSIADSVKAGKYDWVNGLITNVNFPITEVDKIDGEKEMVIFSFGKAVSSEEAIEFMKTEGCRPATMRELLSFGEKNPEVQLRNPVVALGQVVKLYGGRHVGCLGRGGSGRYAGLRYFDVGWGGRCRFLAVRN